MDHYKVSKLTETISNCIDELVKLLEEEAENASNWEDKYDEQTSKIDDLENDISDLKEEVKELRSENIMLQNTMDNMSEKFVN